MLDASVLVVDDMRSMRTFVKQALTGMGLLDIKEAADGLEALSFLRKGGIDLVVCDIEMPKMSGLELLAAVRGDEGLADVPFIMLSAVNQRSKVMDALGKGVCDYVVKPINPEILERRVRSVLKRREATADCGRHSSAGPA